jgi:hypothetical protein
MKSFLQRFTLFVAGVLQGLDRVVFRGRLPLLYAPEGMNWLLKLNHVLRKDFKPYAQAITSQLLKASLVAEAKSLNRYRYLNSSHTDKEKLAHQIAAEHKIREGLVCVLQTLEP